jgi:NAD(P)-dependent dehydrogenase (short-subunit alcohol dehydrogenase family)
MGALDGKVAVITGGSSNIGLKIAQRFAGEGAEVVIAARNRDNLAKAVALIGHGARGVSVEAADEAQMKALIDPLPRIDLLVTCAGHWAFGPIDKVPPKEWIDLFAGRFFGQIYACHYAVPKMPRGSCIMLCSGIAAHSGQPNYAGGSALCGAVNSMGRALAVELAPRDIRVNVLSPGLILSDEDNKNLRAGGFTNDLRLGYVERSIPLRRPGRPENMAEAAMFLAVCDYATGLVLDIDGGWTSV